MLSHVADAANLITLAGIAASVLAIALALRGQYAGCGIALVGAFLADVIDGPVAARTHGRTVDQGAFGANLDSFADMISAGAALGVVVVSYGHFGAGYVVAAIVLAAATALRLSYFNVHGLDADSASYTGLPTDQTVLSFVALMLLAEPLGTSAFRIVLALGAVALAALMVSSVQVPKLTGRWYAASIVVAVALAAAHLARLLT